MKYILLPLAFVAFCFNSQAQEIASNTNSPKDNSLYYFSSDTIKSANDTVKKRKGQELKEVIVTGNKHTKTSFSFAFWFKTNGYSTKCTSNWYMK